MDKQKVRAVVQSRLDAISAKEYIALSEAAYKNVEALFDRLHRDGKTNSVLLYDALPRWREVPLFELERNYSGSTFDYAPSSKNASFPTTKYSVIFVPLFGFNEEGYRLGHGGGWYDKLLSEQSQAVKVGVGFEAGCCTFAEESHDIPMDYIVTETRPGIPRKRKHR